jgi:hypothetical protein
MPDFKRDERVMIEHRCKQYEAQIIGVFTKNGVTTYEVFVFEKGMALRKKEKYVSSL